MQKEQSGKPVLIIIAIALLAFLNAASSQADVKKIRTALHHPYVYLANGVVAALDPSSSYNLTMKYNDTCTPQPNSPMNRIHFVSSEIPYTTGLNMTIDTSDAFCLMDPKQPSHFPHAMQQLYGCFSFWYENPTKTPIMAAEHKYNGKLMRQTVTRGFLEMMKSII